MGSESLSHSDIQSQISKSRVTLVFSYTPVELDYVV